MKRNEFSIGSFLKEKNIIMNYIYDPIGNSKIGVVVGVKGATRDNPLVGFAMFDEFTSMGAKQTHREATPMCQNDNYKAVLNTVEKALETDGQKKAFDVIKKAVVFQTVDPPANNIIYKAVELAYMRANTNREEFFVCKNPAYNQAGSKLYSTKKGTALNLCGRSVISDLYGLTIVAVRKAVRAMEYRCWKYYKG